MGPLSGNVWPTPKALPVSKTDRPRFCREVERPGRRLLVLGFSGGPKRQLETGNADLWIGRFLLPKLADAVGDEMPVRRRLRIRIRADAVYRIRPAQPERNNGAYVIGFAIPIDRAQSLVDGVPAGRFVGVVRWIGHFRGLF